MRTHTVIESPVGELTLVAEDNALIAVGMSVPGRSPRMDLGERSAKGFESAAEQLAEYFTGRRTEFDVDLSPRGGPFQKRVWDVLRRIPYGSTCSYGEIAGELGDRSLAQAVGSANGRNPLAIVIPCHRVIGADGKLVGYAGGLERKEYLLNLENPSRAMPQKLF